jgi:hopanoid C-2 methylase
MSIAFSGGPAMKRSHFNLDPEFPENRSSYLAQNTRCILCVFPEYDCSFGTLHYAYPFIPNVKAFMPPQGLLMIAACLPQHWEVRLVDENLGRCSMDDLAWADAVLVSGMHIQRPQMLRINQMAHQQGKLTVLGGAAVSAAPEEYPDFDILHIGELGDATDDLITYLDLHCERPSSQIRLVTDHRLPFQSFPLPAYHLLDLRHYLLANIQFSSGCSYQCESCEIPELYGHVPRHKSALQIIRELDAMLFAGNSGTVYFIDDNFLADPRAAAKLLPHLVDWQMRNSYPVEFACEATLNLALHPEILALMREAYFCTVFFAIESPAPEALQSISKHRNLKIPITEAIQTFNHYGIEVLSGIVMGLDGEPERIDEEIISFIRSSQIPIFTINLLNALPRTPLWRRLEQGKRLIDPCGRKSNVEYLVPYQKILSQWKRCIAFAYDPESLYRRFCYQLEHTYLNRIEVPNGPERLCWRSIRDSILIAANLFIRVGVLSSYRSTFWRMARLALKHGDIEGFIHVGLVSHHLIQYAKECENCAEVTDLPLPRFSKDAQDAQDAQDSKDSKDAEDAECSVGSKYSGDAKYSVNAKYSVDPRSSQKSRNSGSIKPISP